MTAARYEADQSGANQAYPVARGHDHDLIGAPYCPSRINVLEQPLFNATGTVKPILDLLPDELKEHKKEPVDLTINKGSVNKQIEKLWKAVLSPSLQEFRGSKRWAARRLGV